MQALPHGAAREDPFTQNACAVTLGTAPPRESARLFRRLQAPPIH
jgi:hypothetical protein